MIETPYSGKKDLHIGGTVARPDTDGGGEVAEGLARELKNVLLSAEDFVRSNPWQTLTVVAVFSLAAGYGLAAAFNPRR